jgi:hypothetical protein
MLFCGTVGASKASNEFSTTKYAIHAVRQGNVFFNWAVGTGKASDEVFSTILTFHFVCHNILLVVDIC